MLNLTFLSQFNLSDEEIRLLLEIGEWVQLDKKADFSEYGKIAKHFYYVQAGLIRVYQIIDGNEVTYSFYLQGEICVDYASILKQEESQFYFEAVTPATVIKFRFEDFENYYDQFPKIGSVIRKVAESAYLKLLDRLKELQTETLEQRYLNLICNNEEIFKQASLQDIASYLGVKPQSLSRIRAKIVKSS
jgi:CRP-like cAMP-binding protein